MNLLISITYYLCMQGIHEAPNSFINLRKGEWNRWIVLTNLAENITFCIELLCIVFVVFACNAAEINGWKRFLQFPEKS